jgi:hypothetical protein
METKHPLATIVVLFLLMTSFVCIFVKSAPGLDMHTSYIYSEKSVFTSEFNPSVNYNTGSNRYYLDVGEDEFTYSYVSFVSFDLSELPDDADIQTARISLYLANDPENIPVKMYRVLDTWDEDTITWGTQPSFKDFSKTKGLIDTVTISSTGRSYWNATPIVKAWFNGTKSNYGVAFESTGEYFHRFSSDDTSYYKPLLAIDYLSSSGGSNPPEEPPEDSEPCEISYTIRPSSPHSGDSVTLTATATDNLGLEYLIIKEGSIELCSEYASTDDTTTLTCVHSETMYAPGKTFIIEANDKGGSPPQSITLPIHVEGSSSAPEVVLSVEYRDMNTVPIFYSLLPGDNQIVNITATASDPDGVSFLTITVNGILHDFLISPPETTVSRTVSFINDDSSRDVLRYSAAATDIEGFYNSTSEEIEIRQPFQWLWGLNFSNWGCSNDHIWSWDMMESIYGDSDIYLDKSKGWKKDWAWRLYDAKIRTGGRDGHCFGMSTLALELAHAPARITPHELQSSATHIDDLRREEWNTTWRYYFARHSGQYSAEVTSSRVAQYLDLYFTDWVASGWTGMHPYLEDLVDTISNDLEHGRFGILSIREGGSGHAVVPWRIVPGETDEDITKIYIYDPNHEYVSSHHVLDYSFFNWYPYIECNVNTKFAGWWLYQWNATSIWQDEIFYFTYDDAIGDVSQLNYIDAVDITDHDIPLGISYLVAIGSGESTFYAEDVEGRRTGLVKGEILSEIPNSVPIIDYQSADPSENLMLYLPEDTKLTFHFDTTRDTAEYTFSLNNQHSTYSLINKTMTKDVEEQLIVTPDKDPGDYQVQLIGAGDAQYSILITKEYTDSNDMSMAREYSLEKSSSNENEDVTLKVISDKKGLYVKNTNDENTSFTFEFKSTEALDDIDYIPRSIGDREMTQNQEVTIGPSDWKTTEELSGVALIQPDSTPGFEILLLILALIIIIAVKRKK